LVGALAALVRFASGVTRRALFTIGAAIIIAVTDRTLTARGAAPTEWAAIGGRSALALTIGTLRMVRRASHTARATMSPAITGLTASTAI